jgi:L-ribulose-5-phosphate 3-epimerase
MFKMPVGLYEKALPAALSWEERLASAGQAGYDFVEISIDETDERLARLDWTAAERAALRRSITNTGVRIMTMCLSGHRKYPLGSHTLELRRQGQDILRKAIEFAGDIGLRVVQVMGYDVFYETSDAETQSNFIESLYLGTLWAGQAGVMLGLENLDTPFVDCLSKALTIIREIDSPWLKLYPDIGNRDRALSRDFSSAGANGLLGLTRGRDVGANARRRGSRRFGRRCPQIGRLFGGRSLACRSANRPPTGGITEAQQRCKVGV